MRKIKFRAWGENSKEFLNDAGGNYGLTLKEIQSIEDVDVWEFTQFTGLKDKNGTEIYEGDIVRAIAESRHKDSTKQATDIVWNELQWQVRDPGYSHGLPMTWGGWESLEVIGNIYENPELLKES